MVQWLRICLPVRQPWVQSLVPEDPTCLGTAKLCTPQLKPVQCGACTPQRGKPPQ